MKAKRVQGDFERRTFKNETIVLDASSFRDCRFAGCAFIYGGGRPPVLSGCDFRDCTWQFEAGAANTMAFLAGLHKGGFADLVDATVASIRAGDMIEDAAPSAPQPTKTKLPETLDFGHGTVPIPRVVMVPKRES